MARDEREEAAAKQAAAEAKATITWRRYGAFAVPYIGTRPATDADLKPPPPPPPWVLRQQRLAAQVQAREQGSKEHMMSDERERLQSEWQPSWTGSEQVASTDGEMVDPRDADDAEALLADTPATRMTCTWTAVERTLASIFSGGNDECTLRQLLAELRREDFGYTRRDVEPILHAMDSMRNGMIMYRDEKVYLM